ncbi:MAG TPA: VOC family protein [Steroidobacteraceae bacterium]|nr:VOC family protein [Steroidobacteraceae bacterium]
MRRGALMLLCIGALTGLDSAAGAGIEFPPLLQPAGPEHPGKLIWAELFTPDLNAAEHFYGQLFGWSFRDIAIGQRAYAVASLDGAPIAGFVQIGARRPGSPQPAWLTFLSVPNVQLAGEAILAHGGKELSAPHAYRLRGKQAVYTDPQGAVFAILNSHSGDPPDVLAAPGEWIWSALVTRDPDSGAAFYQQVFGFEVFPLQSGVRGDHLMLASEQFARASVNPLPRDDSQPHWVDFVRVQDVNRTAETATNLGGRILVAPHADRHGGTVALLADPSGAAIGVMDWTETSPPGAAK